MPKNRAILKCRFILKRTFDEIEVKGAKGRIRKAGDDLTEIDYDYVFEPYAKGEYGELEIYVFENDLEFY